MKYGIVHVGQQTKIYIYESYEKALEYLPQWQALYPNDSFTIEEFRQV